MDPILSAVLHEGISSLYKGNGLTDVNIRVEDQTFSCHRLVLSAVSPYFLSLFTNDFKDKTMEEVVLQNVKPDIFQCILSYIYFSEESVINAANVQDIFITASMFLMQHVVHICEKFMSKNISATNAINILRFADSLSYKSLIHLSKNFILQEFESVSQEDEFLHLKPCDLIEIIRDQDLNVTKEETVSDAVLRWMSADEEARKPNLHEVFQHVRLPLTRPEYVFSLSKKYPFLYESVEITQLLDEAKSFHCQKTGAHNCSSKRMIYRNCSEMVNGIVCVTDQHVQLYSFQNEKWVEANSLPSDPGFLFASCVFRSNFYLSGGAKHKSGELFEFKPEENTWVSLAELGSKRYRHALVADSKMIYLIGGTYGEQEFSSDVTEFNRNRNSYEHIGHLDIPARSMDAVLVEEKIITFGGKTDHNSCGSKHIQYFDLVTKQSSTIPLELSVNVTFTGATAIDELVYFFERNGQLHEFTGGVITKQAFGCLGSFDDAGMELRMCYFNGKLYVCYEKDMRFVVLDLKKEKQEVLICHHSFITVENSCAVGHVTLLKKYFQ